MAFRAGHTFSTDISFSQDTLLEITPDDVCHWMNFRAFGDANPAEDAKPVNARASTLEYAKKAISSFMPRRTVPWDPIRNEGNPTRSETVNAVIKKVKRCEVRREGVQSAARRPIEYGEFLNLLDQVHTGNGKGSLKYLVCAVLTMQWHLIARIDDMMKLKFDSFSCSIHHPGSLICQLRWSKNISEERDAPEQIVLGSMDPRLCALLNLAIHVEMTDKAALSPFVFGNPQDGDRVVRRFLQDVFEGTDFHKLKAGNLGTHSMRKGAATYGSRTGLPKDYVNRRGRWRTRKSVVDVYIDNTQPYPDAIAAGVLAGPLGPCCYVLKDGVQVVTNDLLVKHVGPALKEAVGEEMARVLALPLLWAALVPRGSFDYEIIPAALKRRIIQAYLGVGGKEDVNVVERVPIHVVGDGAQLQLVEVHDNAGENGVLDRQNGGLTADSTRKEFASIHSQLFSLQRQTANLLNEILRSRTERQRENQKILAVIRRIALQPVVRTIHPLSSANGGGDGVEEEGSVVLPRAMLSKRPKDLYELWGEYEFGLNGLKPAKEFTAAERGANKFAYSRRKVFWDVVSAFVRTGFTSDVAIDKIYAAYGRQLSVTRILAALRTDKHQGGHPSLRL
ncbi:hypothetical protein AM588_10000277 [Phytophthora nicotianae]|uniref:Uncharacterized protein n=3 Tax=Phytophthora nicotianae TaxID=4792 RepID=A0A0W8CC47_PHYNI|nr:hypothetical protein AM588_10000277 [Phytophthora nicotianae]